MARIRQNAQNKQDFVDTGEQLDANIKGLPIPSTRAQVVSAFSALEHMTASEHCEDMLRCVN